MKYSSLTSNTKPIPITVETKDKQTINLTELVALVRRGKPAWPLNSSPNNTKAHTLWSTCDEQEQGQTLIRTHLVQLIISRLIPSILTVSLDRPNS